MGKEGEAGNPAGLPMQPDAVHGGFSRSKPKGYSDRLWKVWDSNVRRFVDLHTHSTISDGATSPSELIRLAEARRLAAVALTDHDTTAGLAEAALEAEKYPHLRFIPGVELSAKFSGGTLHILGLGIDAASGSLAKLLERLLSARQQRNPRMADLLVQLGVDVTLADARAVADEGTKVIGRLHFAQAMMRKGYVKTIGEAFKKYIGPGCPAYVDKEQSSPAEIIAGIRKAGGIAVLAHPPQLNCRNSAQLRRILAELASHGLGGIEAYHSDHSPQQTREYLALARCHGLTVAGGSDFHGSPKPNSKLGYPRVPLAAISGELAEMILAG